MYNNFECTVVEEGETTEWFQVQSIVKQGCTMSGFLFLLSIDWVMTRTTEGRRTGIQWKLTSVLEDLDFADDIALLSSRYVDIEELLCLGALLDKKGGATKDIQLSKANPFSASESSRL